MGKPQWKYEESNRLYSQQPKRCHVIQNCEVITKVDIGSDHRMVRAEIHLNKKKKKKNLADLNLSSMKRKAG